MSKWKKAKERLMGCPKDYSNRELMDFLNSLGYEDLSKGEISTKNIALFEKSQSRIILLPRKEYIDSCLLKALIGSLMENGDL